MIEFQMKVGSELDKKLLKQYQTRSVYDSVSSYREFLQNTYGIKSEWEFPYFTLYFESDNDLTLFLLKV